MATVRWSIFPGATEGQVTQAVGAATVTNNIELTVDMGNTMDGTTRVISREEVLLALQRLRDYIVDHPWTPQ
jgi:hypothetical protein